MTVANSNDDEGVGLGSIVLVEKGEEGVRVTYRDGSRSFFSGEVGFEIWRKWESREGQNERLN